MEDKIRKWEEFIYGCLSPESIKYRKLMAQSDPEEAPYTSRYAAAGIQDSLIKSALTFSEDAEHMQIEINDRAVSFHTIVGRLLIRKGLALIETDLLSEAEKAFREGLISLDAGQPCQDMCFQMAALNNIGILYCNRQDFDEALKHLSEVEKIYQNVSPSNLLVTQGLNRVEDQSEHEAEVWFEELFTLALFYLAQVYQKKQDENRAANYCAMTLSRQLRFGTPSPNWKVQKSSRPKMSAALRCCTHRCVLLIHPQY